VSWAVAAVVALLTLWGWLIYTTPPKCEACGDDPCDFCADGDVPPELGDVPPERKSVERAALSVAALAFLAGMTP
jgi:hypothetical protein